MSQDTPIAKLRNHYRQLRNEQQTWLPFWRDARDYVAPQRGRSLGVTSANETNNGGISDAKRINGVASRALGVLASGMQSGLTSKARQWFLLNHPDPAFNRFKPVREWYDLVQEVLERIFRRSNIYSAFLHTYNEMALFGQGAVALLDHPDRVLHCRPYTTGTYCISTDVYGDVDCFFHTEFLTLRQLADAFGKENLPDDLRENYDNGRYETKHEVVNAILRHPEVYGLKNSERLPVASVHFLAKSQENKDKFLRQSGYRSFPVMTPRWDVIDNDVYGWCPTRDVIGDVRMLQNMEADTLKGVKKTVSPPMRIPPELSRKGLNTQPNALNVVTAMNEHAVAPLYAANLNVQQLQMKVTAIEENIRDGYFNSLFLALLSQDNPQMTAREVAERHEEKLLMLGPVLERIHTELLDPVIDRAFIIAWDAGLIPPPPQELEGEPTQVEYVSILSQAQKAVGVNRIEQSLAFLSSLAQMYPEVRNTLDPVKTYQEYNNMIGVRSGIFRSEEEYQKLTQQEQQVAQAQQAAAVGESMSNSVKTLGDTDMANVQQLLSGGNAGGLVL